MHRSYALFLLALAGFAAIALPAVAQNRGLGARGVAGVELLDGWLQPDGTRVVGVQIDLMPGWHTYWRVPGEAGIPPDFDWSRSGNLQSVALEWPRPQIFDTAGLQSIGYAGRVVLPVVLTAENPSAPIDVDLRLAFGVCSDICVPAEARITGRLASDQPVEGRQAIAAALAEGAWSPAQAGVVAVACNLAAGAKGPELTAEVTLAAGPAADEVGVIEANKPGIWMGTAVTRTEGNRVVVRARIFGGKQALDRRDVSVSLLNAERVVEIRGCGAAAVAGK